MPYRICSRDELKHQDEFQTSMDCSLATPRFNYMKNSLVYNKTNAANLEFPEFCKGMMLCSLCTTVGRGASSDSRPPCYLLHRTHHGLAILRSASSTTPLFDLQQLYKALLIIKEGHVDGPSLAVELASEIKHSVDLENHMHVDYENAISQNGSII
jgi:hypothetical protein